MAQIIGAYEDTLWEHLLGCIRENRKDGKRVIVIVPGHFTLDTERRLLTDLALPGFFDIEVLSPARLNNRVFSLAGSSSLTRIDRCGRQMALSRVLAAEKENLVYYKSAPTSPGFIEKVASQITELKQAGISPDTFAAGIGDSDKLKDLSLIYECYEDLLSGRFQDGEDETRDMLARLPESRLVENTAVYVWGFDTITAQMASVISGIGQLARDVKVLCVYMSSRIFLPVLQSMHRLKEHLDRTGLVCELLFPPNTVCRKAPEIRFLQEFLPRSRYPAYRDTPGAVSLFAAPDTHTELHLIAEKMLLLHRAGMAFGDMALTLDGSESAFSAARAIMGAYRVPVYIAQKQTALSHAAARFVLCSLRALDIWRPQELIGIMKSGFSPL